MVLWLMQLGAGDSVHLREKGRVDIFAHYSVVSARMVLDVISELNPDPANFSN